LWRWQPPFSVHLKGNSAVMPDLVLGSEVLVDPVLGLDPVEDPDSVGVLEDP
jgi:hypothetical protein